MNICGYSEWLKEKDVRFSQEVREEILQMQQPCARCGGRGRIIKEPCPKCGGKGRVKVNKTVTVNIPAGIDDGQTVAVRGQGDSGRNGGPAGDLIITVGVRKHSFFERDGYNLLCEIPLTIPEATLGAEIKVPTLDGDIPYTIPEGTQNGTVFTVRGKGIPYVNSTRRGDLIFRVTVEIPKGLNDKQKEAMRAFADACGEVNYAKHKQFFRKIFGQGKK